MVQTLRRLYRSSARIEITNSGNEVGKEVQLEQGQKETTGNLERLGEFVSYLYNLVPGGSTPQIVEVSSGTGSGAGSSVCTSSRREPQAAEVSRPGLFISGDEFIGFAPPFLLDFLAPIFLFLIEEIAPTIQRAFGWPRAAWLSCFVTRLQFLV